MDNIEKQLAQTVTLIVSKWKKFNREITKFFTAQDDSYYSTEIVPGKNRASYILGHLIVSNDDLFSIFGFGEPLYPGLATFYYSADRAYPDSDLPSIAELRTYWKNVNLQLEEKFSNMSPGDWLEKHTAVSEEGFKADPTRNKLGVLLNRTLHISHHIGQLNLMENPKLVVTNTNK